MTLPHATRAGGRDREPALPQLVGDADLAKSRLLDGNRHDGVFDLLCDAVFSCQTPPCTVNQSVPF